jgi:hypothetical protein
MTDLVQSEGGISGAGSTILTSYPYLVFSLSLFAIFLLLFTQARHQRPLLVFSGLGSAAFSFSSYVFVPEYWDPVRVWSLVVGPEDLVFSFANGGIVWSIASWRRLVLPGFERSGAIFAKRFFGWTLLGLASSAPPHFAGFSSMTCCFCAMAVVGCVALISRPDLLKFAIAGAVGFSCLYTVLGVAIMIALPDFSTQWTHENLSGVDLLSLPIEETLWAFGFGAVFPLIVASSANVRLT